MIKQLVQVFILLLVLATAIMYPIYDTYKNATPEQLQEIRQWYVDGLLYEDDIWRVSKDGKINNNEYYYLTTLVNGRKLLTEITDK